MNAGQDDPRPVTPLAPVLAYRAADSAPRLNWPQVLLMFWSTVAGAALSVYGYELQIAWLLNLLHVQQVLVNDVTVLDEQRMIFAGINAASGTLAAVLALLLRRRSGWIHMSGLMLISAAIFAIGVGIGLSYLRVTVPSLLMSVMPVPISVPISLDHLPVFVAPFSGCGALLAACLIVGLWRARRGRPTRVRY